MTGVRLCDAAGISETVLHTPQAKRLLLEAAQAMVRAGVAVSLADWSTWSPTERAWYTAAVESDDRATAAAIVRILDGVPEPDTAEGVLGDLLDRATEAGP